MEAFYPIVILLLAAGTLAEISANYKDQILAYHTKVRKSRHASNMHKLDWDDKLAAKAESWVSKCVFEHENAGYGENLAFDDAGEGADFTDQINTALESWFNESYDFNSAGGQQPCGYTSSCHYTQMVWHSDRLIGCSYKVCPSFDSRVAGTLKNVFYFGCWYYPKGNWVENGKMKPFNEGPPASECEEGEDQEDGLCTGTPKCKDKQKDGCRMSEAMGQCTSNKKYMESHCQKTCGICEGGDEEVCQNKQSTCDTYVTDSVRKDNARMRQNCVTPYMFEGCRKTCGFCNKNWAEAQQMYR